MGAGRPVPRQFQSLGAGGRDGDAAFRLDSWRLPGELGRCCRCPGPPGLTFPSQHLLDFPDGAHRPADLRIRNMALEHSFRNLTEDERAALMRVAIGTAFEGGETVINQGDTVANLMVVSKGMLRVTHVFEGGHLSEFVGPLGPGDVVGEMSFVDGKGASATLIADGETEVLTIPRDAIDSLATKDPSFDGRFYKDLFMHLSRRLRATNLRADPGPAAGG
ncbi:MAG: hypothetical protein CMM61_01855 [Rhodospirillaceae bacterium]|nr:hypothetical protein [Rhodospirillaceae bacterium]